VIGDRLFGLVSACQTQSGSLLFPSSGVPVSDRPSLLVLVLSEPTLGCVSVSVRLCEIGRARSAGPHSFGFAIDGASKTRAGSGRPFGGGRGKGVGCMTFYGDRRFLSSAFDRPLLLQPYQSVERIAAPHAKEPSPGQRFERITRISNISFAC
jgi:hypothetical protein